MQTRRSSETAAALRRMQPIIVLDIDSDTSVPWPHSQNLKSMRAGPRLLSRYKDNSATLYEALDCQSPSELSLPASACRDCGRTLKDLQTDIELIEYRLQQAFRTLAESFAPPPPPRSNTGQTITVDLRSSEDLPRLYECIAEAARQALVVPRRVRVIFEDLD